MKGKYLLVGLLIAVLAIGGTGYGVSAGSGDKVTGGGTFYHNGWLPTPYATNGDKISFGFNAQSQGDDAKGHLHLVNNTSGMKVSGTVSEISVSGGIVRFSGECSIDGVPTVFWAEVSDGGEGGDSYDVIMGIWFGSKGPRPDISGQLDKGNIQKH